MPSAFNEEEECRPYLWTTREVIGWLKAKGFVEYQSLFQNHDIDGEALLLLREDDIVKGLKVEKVGHVKKLWHQIELLQSRHNYTNLRLNNNHAHYQSDFPAECSHCCYLQPEPKSDSSIWRKQANIWKTFISFFYLFTVSWISSVVLVIVHERVPDRYPPLPDLILENLPFIPWAFDASEIIAGLLAMTWICITIFHKHRLILWRRMCAVLGTIFLLRAITMLITSLSLPSTHLSDLCETKHKYENMYDRLARAFEIFSGIGMSTLGVKTCGDYMFSGHTSVLTAVTLFVNEYVPIRMAYMQVASWVLCLFAIFFILAAHEHYSIDVFIAFYITSRLFQYYHSLANSCAHLQMKTQVWFPMFSFFEADCPGPVPNEYEIPFKNYFHRMLSSPAYKLDSKKC